MSNTLLRIRDWNTLYENHDTRRLNTLAWVPVPNKLDGEGYACLVQYENGAAHLGVWLVILEIGSTCTPRGTLLRNLDGGPHTPLSLSLKSRIPVELFEEAIPRLLANRWLEAIEYDPDDMARQRHEEMARQRRGIVAAMPHTSAAEGKGTEGNGTEEKGNEREESARLISDLKPKPSQDQDPGRWFRSVYTGECPDDKELDDLIGQYVEHTPETRAAFYANVPLWSQTKKYKSGFAPRARYFIADGTWKHPPHDDLTQRNTTNVFDELIEKHKREHGHRQSTNDPETA